MQIKRSDKQYTDIETFEEYEFTSCIAYEMAIRHPRVIEIYRYHFLKENKPLNYKCCEDHILFGMPDVYYVDYHFFNDIDHGINHTEEKTFDESISEDEVVIKTFKEYNGFLRSTTIEKNDMDSGGVPFYRENTIRPWFKRPKIWTEKFDGTSHVALDLNLPANELMDFVRHLKETYDNGIINSPYDEFIQTLPKQSSTSLGKGYKMADTFFIYDALKLGYTKKKIQIDVYNYYADKGIDTRTLDYKTIKKYHEFAIEYIDNKRYLEIVTNKKIEDINLEAWYKK